LQRRRLGHIAHRKHDRSGLSVRRSPAAANASVPYKGCAAARDAVRSK